MYIRKCTNVIIITSIKLCKLHIKVLPAAQIVTFLGGLTRYKQIE